MREALACICAIVLVQPVSAVQESKSRSGRMTDPEVEALAKNALGLTDPKEMQAALSRLKQHHFRSSLVKEREFVLYAQGLMEDRLGHTREAATILRKLEHTWPQSPFLGEAQTILAADALDLAHYKEAELRLKRALQAEIPVENKRRAQELLLWSLAEQGHQSDGLSIINSLYPLGTAKPSERGLVAMVEVLCLAQQKEQASATRKDLNSLYPNSSYRLRADLAWARMQGQTGEVKDAAETFRKILIDQPSAPEADEARLALATLLSEGKLPKKEADAFPKPQKLLDDLRNTNRKGDPVRRVLLVQLRLCMNESRWKDAIDTVSKLRTQAPSSEESALANALRGDAFRAWTQQLLDGSQVGPLLPYLDREGIQSLSPDQRSTLVRNLVQTGLPSAAKTVTDLSPTKETVPLRKIALAALAPQTHPEETLGLLSGKNENPSESLRRVQSFVALKRWEAVPAPLSRATPGTDRINALLMYLRRPLGKDERLTSRVKEAEAWLARSPEKGTIREPLIILVADLHSQSGDWKGALSLYPANPETNSLGWVALMRATCQLKLGQKAAAKSTLKAAVDAPGFKMERETLGKQLGL